MFERRRTQISLDDHLVKALTQTKIEEHRCHIPDGRHTNGRIRLKVTISVFLPVKRFPQPIGPTPVVNDQIGIINAQPVKAMFE